MFSVDVKHHVYLFSCLAVRTQELCESRGGRLRGREAALNKPIAIKMLGSLEDDVGSIPPFHSPFSLKVVVYRLCLMTLSLTIIERFKRALIAARLNHSSGAV